MNVVSSSGEHVGREVMIEYQDVKDAVLETARELAEQGPGWAQQAVVLRRVAEKLAPRLGSGLKVEQVILTAWHDLFLERRLSWGYNLDNPNAPFFHVPAREAQLVG
jgi:hypothetical protein